MLYTFIRLKTGTVVKVPATDKAVDEVFNHDPYATILHQNVTDLPKQQINHLEDWQTYKEAQQ